MVRSLVVIGSGIAGLFAALTARRQGVHDVVIVTKAALEESATRTVAPIGPVGRAGSEMAA